MLVGMNNPQSIHVRMSPQHMAKLQELVGHHGLRASELIRRWLDTEWEKVQAQAQVEAAVAPLRAMRRAWEEQVGD